jgi:type VI secretion system protein ImpF
VAKEMPNASLVASVLDRLLDDDPRAGDPKLETLDIKDPVVLAGRLKACGDPLSRYVTEQLLSHEREILDTYQGGKPIPYEVEALLAAVLNRVIEGPFIYDRQRFSAVKLSGELQQMMEESRKTASASLLNRVLLEEAYGGELHRVRKTSFSSVSFRELKRSVSRDIEHLLNTRRELLEGVSPAYKEVAGSLLMYGLPDFTSLSLMNSQHRKQIRRVVEEALGKFEPRLKSVRVSLEAQDKFDPTLRFHIDALLRTDTASEPVTFDATLQLTTSQYSVRSDV